MEVPATIKKRVIDLLFEAWLQEVGETGDLPATNREDLRDAFGAGIEYWQELTKD